ncbi:hypothetical protein Tco_0728250 [Tanacetum coccineum]|uniref:Retrovirus-related Pol polyprotein from transposon TNT 1-94-like beta-barrel domain-containing protein n=1 Tax=Tanacetum coccineum TaxID=301880 RepID=A0ABQ4YKM3_9ASTR
MSTPVNTSSTDSQMHNNIMAAGSKDRPPMLGPGRYSQWRSRFLRYIDTKPNGGGLKKSILSGPYMPTTVQVQAVEAAEGRPASQQKKCDKPLKEQQGESLNVQDVKTSVWKFGSLLLRDENPKKSSRFVMIVNNLKIDIVSYHRLFDILKQFQLEVNDIRAERIAKSANPLALIAAAQPYSDNYYQAPKPQTEQADWLEDTDEEIDEQELEAHYSYMALDSGESHLYLNDVNTRTKKPNVVPISASKPKRKANKSVATPHKKTIVQLILFIVDSGCTKHMTGNLKLLCNFVEKFLGTVRFGNDQFDPILGYGESDSRKVLSNGLTTVKASIIIFLGCQICDADLRGCFRKSTWFCKRSSRETI